MLPVGTVQVTEKFTVDAAPVETVMFWLAGTTQPLGRLATETVREPVATPVTV
jgi:hypothetical protein